jgi:RNA-directed DNA polymerase
MTGATGNRRTSMRATDKPFNIDKNLVYEGYKAVKSNGGAAGVDGETIEQFESDLKSNLYKLWNRMSSGSYFPPPVRAVSIPKTVWRASDFRCAHRSRLRGADSGQAGD